MIENTSSAGILDTASDTEAMADHSNLHGPDF